MFFKASVLLLTITILYVQVQCKNDEQKQEQTQAEGQVEVEGPSPSTKHITLSELANRIATTVQSINSKNVEGHSVKVDPQPQEDTSRARTLNDPSSTLQVPELIYNQDNQSSISNSQDHLTRNSPVGTVEDKNTGVSARTSQTGSSFKDHYLQEAISKVIQNFLESDASEQQRKGFVEEEKHLEGALIHHGVLQETENYDNSRDKYQHAYEVDDNIAGGYKKSWESRDNGKVVGGYIYDDGNILREVNYVADENGFRITKETIQPSIKSKSPLNGEAAVRMYKDGEGVEYFITDEKKKKN